jgi:hypothetical protein
MVRSMGVNLKDGPLSGRRVAAVAVAVGVHLALLIALLRPASHPASTTNQVVEDEAALLELSFISSPPITSSSSTPQAPTVAGRRVAPTSEPVRSRIRGTRAAVVGTEANSPSIAASSTSLTFPVVPAVFVRPALGRLITEPTSTGDGGFRKRLGDAQHSRDVRGVPGSDANAVPGIQLTDPQDQGVGAVMRSTQRLFGITDRHCIDVEVWQSLSPDELIARHLTPADIQRQSDRYSCNRPLGLNF